MTDENQPQTLEQRIEYANDQSAVLGYLQADPEVSYQQAIEAHNRIGEKLVARHGSEDAITERCRYSFRVKEYHDGTQWLNLEPVDGHLPHLKRGLMGFDLKDGTTRAGAKEIAQFLNDNITTTSYTG